ncbi:MAG: filamentous hemagglutinin N-terminal domain-containing protein [Leptolyngbya sp. BL-A-14]
MTCNKKPWGNAVSWLWLLNFAGLMYAFPGTIAAEAQIIPDDSLGSEVSRVSPNALIKGLSSDRIDGGAIRGVNLFHSFRDFNVRDGQRVYFTNPVGIDTILSRVTGHSASNILGTLGVLGSANLFLINPNGIIFGPKAHLDVAGSFIASTASKLVFNNGLEFSATNPQAPPLLAVNLVPGLQYGASAIGATIVNGGQLVTGQDLVLTADRLELQGQLLAGRDLILQAQATVNVRDSFTVPFLAQAGRDLTLQGNQGIDLLALNHPTQTPFISGRTLNLISDGPIAADAHFASGGLFQVRSLSGQPATVTSLYDPIISSAGDIDIAGSYSGAALLVESLGNIRFQGAVTITSPDFNFSAINPDLDLATLGSARAFIVRSNRTNLAYPSTALPTTVNGAAVQAGSTVPTGITLQGNVITTGGPVLLEAGAGNVNVQRISTEISAGNNPAGNGGAISIFARTGGITTRILTTRSLSAVASGNGGTVTLFAGNGGINSQAIFTSTAGNTSGNGGAVNLTAVNGDIDFAARGVSIGTLSISATGAAGNAGSVSLSATNGNIRLNGLVDTSSTSRRSPFAGNGGDINLLTTNGSIQVANLFSYSSYPPGFGANFLSSSAGGSITVAAPQGSLNVGNLLALSLAGKGGSIQLTAQGDIGTASLNTTGKVGSGNITVLSQGAFFNNQFVDPNLATLPNNLITSDTFGTGRGGDIAIAAQTIRLSGGVQLSASTHNSGNGGNISLRANTTEFNGVFPQQSLNYGIFAPAGIAGIPAGTYWGGYIPTGEIPSNVTSVQGVTFPTGVFTQTTVGSSGNAGTINLEAGQLIVGDGAAIGVTTFGQRNAGTIQVTVPNGSIVLDQGSIFSGVAPGSQGSSGRLALQTKALSLTNGGVLQTQTLGAGSAGSIQINATEAVTLSGAKSAIRSGSGDAATHGSPIGQGGDIQITSGSVRVSGQATLDAQTFTASRGGNILVDTDSLTILSGGQLRTTTAGIGQAGNMTIKTPEIQLAGATSGLFAQTTSTARAGDLTLQSRGNGQTLTVNFQDNTQISASTSGSGSGGNLLITAPGSVTLHGNGFVSAETTDRGVGGNITLMTGALTIRDGARATVSSQGTAQAGDAGSLDVRANTVLLDRQGQLIAATASGNGGNIGLNVQDLLLLRHNSLISATAGTAQAGGNGGNIAIAAPFIIGVLSENSDITANAFTGNGGNITLTTNAIYGLQVQPRLTPLSDITASSRFGLNGTITLNTLNIDPSRGLVALPLNLVDPSRQIAQSCAPRGKQASSSFIVTGRGGLPPAPGEKFHSASIITPWGTVEEGDNGQSEPRPSAVESSRVEIQPARGAIVETQGWIRDETGAIVLVAQAPTMTPYRFWSGTMPCDHNQLPISTYGAQ